RGTRRALKAGRSFGLRSTQLSRSISCARSSSASSGSRPAPRRQARRGRGRPQGLQFLQSFRYFRYIEVVRFSRRAELIEPHSKPVVRRVCEVRLEVGLRVELEQCDVGEVPRKRVIRSASHSPGTDSESPDDGNRRLRLSQRVDQLYAVAGRQIRLRREQDDVEDHRPPRLPGPRPPGPRPPGPRPPGPRPPPDPRLPPGPRPPPGPRVPTGFRGPRDPPGPRCPPNPPGPRPPPNPRAPPGLRAPLGPRPPPGP